MRTVGASTMIGGSGRGIGGIGDRLADVDLGDAGQRDDLARLDLLHLERAPALRG